MQSKAKKTVKHELVQVYKSLKVIKDHLEEEDMATDDSFMTVDSSSSVSSVEAPRQGDRPQKPPRKDSVKKKKMLDSALSRATDSRLPAEANMGKNIYKI